MGALGRPAGRLSVALAAFLLLTLAAVLTPSDTQALSPARPAHIVLVSDPDRPVRAGSGGTAQVCFNLLSVRYARVGGDDTVYVDPVYLERRPGFPPFPPHASLRDNTYGVEITAAPKGITKGRNVNLSPCAELGLGTHTVTWAWNGPDGTFAKKQTSTTITVVEHDSPPAAPTAIARLYHTNSNRTVAVLDGSASWDPDEGPLTYSWTQVSGLPVRSGVPSTQKTVTVTNGGGPSMFRLTVTNPGGLSDTDEVEVLLYGGEPFFPANSLIVYVGQSPPLHLGKAMEPMVLPEAAGGNGALTYTLTSEPPGLAGLAFDPATRRLSGTPSAEGHWRFTYQADDADGSTGHQVFVVRVHGSPTFSTVSVPDLDLTPGEAMAPVVLPEATGGNGALTYTLTSEPPGLAGLAFDPATLRLSGTPPAESGSWTFTYRADDADRDRTTQTGTGRTRTRRFGTFA